MIIFLYGADNFSSLRKLQTIKNKYFSTNGENSDLVELEGSNIDARSLEGILATQPLFSSTRLIILKNLLLEGNKECQAAFLALVDRVPIKTVVVVFEAGNPDRRSALFKKLIQAGKSQEFKPLNAFQLQHYIRRRAGELGLTMTTAAERFMIDNFRDLWQLENDLQKINHAVGRIKASQRIVDDNQIRLLVREKGQANIFALGEAILKKSPSAFAILNNLLAQGENPFYILSLIASSLRSAILVADAQQLGLFNIDSISRHTGLKPFVIQKIQPLLQKHTLAHLVKWFDNLILTDLAIKNGIIEPELGLELYVLNPNIEFNQALAFK